MDVETLQGPKYNVAETHASQLYLYDWGPGTQNKVDMLC